MSSAGDYNVGDLVRLKNNFDKDRQMGIITKVKEKVHLKSSGTAAVVIVYWFAIRESDWGYTFFLEKISNENLTTDPE